MGGHAGTKSYGTKSCGTKSCGTKSCGTLSHTLQGISSLDPIVRLKSAFNETNCRSFMDN